MSEPRLPNSPSAAADTAGDVLERRKTEVIRKAAANLPSDDGDPIRLKKLEIMEKVLASFEDTNMNSDYLDEIDNFHSYRYQPLTPTLAYLDKIEERLQILKDIKATKLKYNDPEIPPEALPTEIITRVVWAAFMAAPIDALRNLLNNMRSGRALERDKKRCVLLGTTDPHVAHIFSHAAISHVSMYRSKLGCLSTIWGEARIKRYQEAHGGSLDVPQNMLSLNYTVHHRWDKAQVAIEPIGQPNNSTIRIRLHILEDTKLRSLRRKRDPSRDEFQWRNDLAQDPREILKPFMDQFSSHSPLELRLVSSVTQHVVRDGHIFDIKARNPALLPSYELLDLQYRISSPPTASDLELRKNDAIRKLAAHLPDHDDADSTRLKKLAIVEKLLASFDDPNMSPFFLDEIESFHSHPPLRPAPAYLGDVELRLQLLRDIKNTKLKREQDSSLPRKYLPAALITANVWAVFIAAPIEALQALLRRMQNGEMRYEHLREGLKSIEDNLPTIMKISRQKHPPPKLLVALTSSTLDLASQIPASRPVAVPYASAYCSKLSCLGFIWEWTRIERYRQQYGYDEDEQNATDRTPNIISLNPIVRHRWDKSQITFEPVHKPDDHTIRWRNDLATDPRKFLDPFVNDKLVTEGPLEIRVGSSVTQHTARDGYVFDITSEDPALLPSYDVLDLRYRIDLMAALVGAGEGSGDAVSSSTAEWECGSSAASGCSREDV
ncbi:hypothetical protein CTA2_4038 [Colletotrichum tanaceti]|uniref:HNH nuclease domain-containing protein n=1 Tax=Colletotrichum tanaceti TaxID=1306861 RepID=A0A4U6XFC5_9PEZI|nr:hypothetical protein CTA2_4038 [Colletotrichum tanaceti]TKW54548.1 hypothetical protein CTA1_2295 [Colletotrichum tanaceti]